ncbi:MAG: deoxyguanosinetriphosphate triphosphohydrolase [Rhodospirillaceae bacterium]|jgi:dGTPase|nr:deoxyguanosinetriphosphate triphosphohydrolase [Rhodospirillaceae bacterium]MBT5373325.1 deoxyguanosinetriphosphate triphosphohydrolase [Rhodospirillaceae bacterium]MBT5751926.1 deoxyguanosinetriphosphate triphosphohydrolase [Rhodospirillaceae bacterium]
MNDATPQAPFACLPETSRGRRFPEPESPPRSPFQRDRDRIIHSAAFRRLKYKTQVFVYHEGDNYRTRLTHSLEVSQIARSVARALGVNEDMAEAVALAHDLGHTPFGHAGEDALNAAMEPFGGFDHNDQALRILTQLERRYAEFDGLNLTWETLEGVIKHNGPLTGPLPTTIANYPQTHDLEVHTYAGLEAQIAALADDIAYNNHDIDDGLRAELFTIDDLADVPLAGPVVHDIQKRYPGLELPRLVHETVRRLINLMVHDLLEETNRRLVQAKPRSAQDIREFGAPIAAFSEEMGENDKALKKFLFASMYRHERVNVMTVNAAKVMAELFTYFHGNPGSLPAPWPTEADGPGTAVTARLVADYIAGMTDRYALKVHGDIPANKKAG